MTEMVFGTAPKQVDDPIMSKWWRTVDRWSMTFIMILFGIGLLLGLAASVPLAERNELNPYHYVKRQAFFGAVALSVMMAVSMMPPKLIKRLAVIGFIFSLLALGLLPFFGTDFGKGAVRWYSLGFGSIQPSEFLKPGFIVVAAWLISGSQEPNGPPGVFWSFTLCTLVVSLLVIQPDFGQSALIVFGWIVMYFIAGAPLLLLAIIGGLLVAGGVTAYTLSEHVARRINGFLSPDLDPRTQLGYATNAIREGGLFGVGVGEGQVKWSLPDAHTDFIIAVAAEEYGMVMVLVIIFLYASIVLKAISRMRKERDTFIRLAGTGLACTFGIQAVINMGVAVRLLPAKGMTLPFVSYGGSSLVAGGIAVGMLLALTRTRPQGELGDLLVTSREPRQRMYAEPSDYN